MGTQKDIEELLEQGVISKETAERIRQYYRSRSQSSRNWVPIVFGILGGLLAGLGVILIIAYNWELLSRSSRTVISFLPLLGAQGAAAYVLRKKEGQRVWTETVSLLLMLAVGASLSLVSQTYHLQGSLSGFLFLWMLLALPVLYVMRSPSASLLYIAGIGYYGWNIIWEIGPDEASYYGLLFLLALPFLVHYIYRQIPDSNFTAFHNWLIPLSLIIGVGSFQQGNNEEFLLPAYFCLFGAMISIGRSHPFRSRDAKRNGYLRFGQLGTLIPLFLTSFEDYWVGLGSIDLQGIEWGGVSPFWAASGLLLISAGVLIYRVIKDGKLDPLEGVWPLFLVFFLVGDEKELFSTVGVNLILLALSVHRIVVGARSERLATLNLGAVIFTIWILCRFFEVELSFLVRGVIFIMLGIGFFVLNWWMLNKRKNYE